MCGGSPPSPFLASRVQHPRPPMLSSVLARLAGRSVMKRSELADLAAFVAVGELLSFRAAAARLGITRSALSHAMQQLEKRLDVRLLHRSTRHVALTDQGRRLFERLRAAFGGIHQALAELDRERASASGLLRLHISAGAMVAVMAPIWSPFPPPPPPLKPHFGPPHP